MTVTDLQVVQIYRWVAFSSRPGCSRPYVNRYDADCPDGVGLRGISSLAEIRAQIRKRGGRPGEVLDGELPATDRNGRTR